jgi:hypothetical protein
MQRFMRSFERNADGSWTCVQPTTFDGPNGRIQVAPGLTVAPGEQFMGIDLARWLEQQFQKGASHD